MLLCVVQVEDDDTSVTHDYIYGDQWTPNTNELRHDGNHHLLGLEYSDSSLESSLPGMTLRLMWVVTPRQRKALQIKCADKENWLLQSIYDADTVDFSLENTRICEWRKGKRKILSLFPPYILLKRHEKASMTSTMEKWTWNWLVDHWWSGSSKDDNNVQLWSSPRTLYITHLQH